MESLKIVKLRKECTKVKRQRLHFKNQNTYKHAVKCPCVFKCVNLQIHAFFITWVVDGIVTFDLYECKNATGEGDICFSVLIIQTGWMN